jgi:uroporphyrinogen III methyltransferase / synthase
MRTPATPLKGKRIVLTRTTEQSALLLRKLEDAGAEVSVLPCVEFCEAEDSAPLDKSVGHLDGFDWLVFTSQNAVKFFSRRLRELRCDPINLSEPRPRVAAIGPTTRDAAIRAGWDVERVTAGIRSGAEFASKMARRAKGKKILLPHSDLAAPGIAEQLREAGAIVTSVVAYRTCVPKSLEATQIDRVVREGADVIVFASPSALRNFAQIVGREAFERFGEQSAFAAIGPTTARSIRDASVPLAMEAAKPNPYELIKVMTEYFVKPNRRKAGR